MTATDCGGCGRSNRAGAQFCGGCGATLTTRCPACGCPAEADERFCTQCGASLDAGPASPAQPASAEGEHKQVTVLFADVARSMELAERLAADEWTQVVQGLFAVCRDAVEAFGGTVDKFTGDGVMALFGAPVAREDHAKRACHAALRLIEAAEAYAQGLRGRGIELTVRIGLNSGEVVAGAVGEAFTAVGHTVGLAQRMESLAEAGTIRVSEHTAALLGDEFGLADLGLTEIKGSSVPVRVFALRATPGSASTAGRRRSGSARLVGREAELSALRAALDDAGEGRAQVVGLVGEAGAGKSRLCDELARHATDLGVTVRRTAGVSHAQAVPLLPILGFLRDYFGVVDGDSSAAVRAKVTDRLLGLDAGFESDLGLIFDFMGVPDPGRLAPQLTPDVRRARVLETFRQVTARRSEQHTLLLILEDLHWFDPHSRVFLEGWLPSFPGSRTLVVTNFRPEFHAPWMGHSFYRQLPLAPLGGSAVLELLDELLGPDPSLAMLAPDLRSRSGGNPFFVEEIVRSLATDGTLAGAPGAYRLTRSAADVRVPATVQAVLAERIDRLTPTEKAVLQAAAVIGRTFTRPVLARVSGQPEAALANALRSLCSAELVQQSQSGTQYQFWHPLTQEVAYGTLLAASRRRLHREVAAGLVELEPDRHDELAPLVATHFEAAGDDREAARWQVRAATRAVRGDLVDAQSRLRKAISYADSVAETRDALVLRVRARTLLLRFGARTGMDSVEADGLYAEARQAAKRIGDPALHAPLSLGGGAVRLFNGDCAGGLSSYLRSCREADEAADEDMQALAYAVAAMTHTYTGPLSAATNAAATSLTHCVDDQRARLAHGISGTDVLCTTRIALLTQYGRLDEATRCIAAAPLDDEHSLVSEWRAWTLSLVAELVACTGEPAAVAGAAELNVARTAVAAGEALAIETEATTCATFLAEERARLDDPAALHTVAAGYEAIGATGHARRIRDELESGGALGAADQPTG